MEAHTPAGGKVGFRILEVQTMTLESLRLARNILLRSAVLCYAFLILSVLLWVPFSQTWTGLTSSWYHIAPDRINTIVINFLTVAKFYAIFILLVPGLALHWTISKEVARK
jgi:hypothetical protein